MGNLVRKRNQMLINTITSGSMVYDAAVGLDIVDYNLFGLHDTVLNFKKETYAAGTAQVETVTPAIAYPTSAQDGAELLVTIQGVPKLGGTSDAGKVSNFHYSGKTFQGYLASLAAENAGFLADADYILLVTQIANAINTDPQFKYLITATVVGVTLVLTASDLTFQFSVAIGVQYGSVVHTTPGVYSVLTSDDVSREFPILPMQAGFDPDTFPSPAIADWTKYYFKIQRGGYSLDGANHKDNVIEEVEFYTSKAQAEATAGVNWDIKISNYLTLVSYPDPDNEGVAAPYGLVIA